MWANSGVMPVSRVVFPGETPETDSAICLDNSDLRRLLHHRLEVLGAALLELARLQSKAARSTLRRGMSIQPKRPLLDALRETLAKAEADPDETPALADLKRILRARIAELETAARLVGTR